MSTPSGPGLVHRGGLGLRSTTGYKQARGEHCCWPLFTGGSFIEPARAHLRLCSLTLPRVGD